MHNLHPGAKLLPGAKLHPGVNLQPLMKRSYVSISNISVLLYGEIRVVKFKIPSVRKMQLHLVLFALFIYTIFKEDNTPVICIHGPPPTGIAVE